MAEHYAHRRLIVELAAINRLPAIYPERSFVEAGGLVSYGMDLADLYRRAAGYIDQILKGAQPGKIPIFQASKFGLFINAKTASALGLTIPPTLLALVDEVIGSARAPRALVFKGRLLNVVHYDEQTVWRRCPRAGAPQTAPPGELTSTPSAAVARSRCF